MIINFEMEIIGRSSDSDQNYETTTAEGRSFIMKCKDQIAEAQALLVCLGANKKQVPGDVGCLARVGGQILGISTQHVMNNHMHFDLSRL